MKLFTDHHGYSQTFKENKLTLGMGFPLEAYEGNVPVMNLAEQVALAKRIDDSSFAALYVRDIPLNDPQFGDVGQMYDPWVFLSYIAAQTKRISLGTASALTSFQHPLNLAKSAASVDAISGGRLLLGLATGDRPIEFDAYQVDQEKRTELFQEALYVMRESWESSFPAISSERVQLTGETDLLPKPSVGTIPVFVTGYSGQTLEWIAEHGDGWFTYPRPLVLQERLIQHYRALTNGFRSFSQSLSIDLAEGPSDGVTHMQLGFTSGRHYLIEHLRELENIGVNHVMLSIKYGQRPADEVIQELIEEVAPHFPAF